MSDNREKIAQDAIGGLSAYALARMADVSAPDRLDSPGANFLLRVRDSTLEALEWRLQDGDELLDALEIIRDAAGEVVGLSAHEIADGAVPIYTHERMMTLVDLAAYHEDLGDLGVPEDMVTLAGYALYAVAERLVNALLTEVEEAAQEAADEDEEA